MDGGKVGFGLLRIFIGVELRRRMLLVISARLLEVFDPAPAITAEVEDAPVPEIDDNVGFSRIFEMRMREISL